MTNRNSIKSSLGTYPVTSVLFSSTLALFTFGIFLLLIFHAARLSDFIKSSVKMQVYLQNNIKDEEILRLESSISDKDFVLKKKNVPQVFFVSKDEAAKSFINETGTNFFQLLGENPLRNSYVLTIDHHYHDNHSLQLIKKDLEEIRGVFEVDYIEDFVDSINKNLTNIGLVLISLVAILFVLVTLMIANTIRLSLYSQRFLIRSMELVGATDKFIKRPFLVRAIFTALLSSNIVSILLVIILYYSNNFLEYSVELQDPLLVLWTIAFLHLVAVVIIYTSTNRSINRYLKMSLDDLY
jgi:cell division transport system permease protein